MKARLLASILGGIGVLTLAASAATAQDVTLKYAHPTSANSSGGLMATDFKTELEALSGGTMKVQIFPDGQLGGLSELNELAASGAVQITANTWGSLGSFDEEAGALDAPYVFANSTERYELITNPKSKIMAELNERLAASNSGLRVIAPVDVSGRQTTCNKAVYSPKDLEGVRFRAIPFPVFTATVEGMGAIAVPIEYNELTTALATGLVDCQENPLSNVLNDKLYEAQTHIMLTNHILAGGPLLVNAELYASLSDQHRQWLDKAALAATRKSLERSSAAEATQRTKLEALGLKFIGPEEGLDIPAFKVGVAKKMKEAFGDKYDRMFKMIEDERAALLN